MNKYCIIAGGGKLPILIRDILNKKGHKVYIIGIKNNFINSKKLTKNFSMVKLGSLSKILKILKNENIKKIILAGSIKRPSFKDISLDLLALRFIRNTKIENLGDDHLLKKLANHFEKLGYKFIQWHKYCPELFTEQNIITFKKPSNNAIKNLQKGLSIFNIFGKSDLGQSIIVQNKIVLGIEAIEGTNELIKRCNLYKKKGDKGILLKLVKKNQDLRFDLPTIGLETLKLLKKYNYEGLYIQKKHCVIIDKYEVVKFADKNNLFICSV